jgi:hypothetical protein
MVLDTGEACAASVSAQPFEAAFHPTAPLLVASLITGHLEVRRRYSIGGACEDASPIVRWSSAPHGVAACAAHPHLHLHTPHASGGGLRDVGC